MHRGDADAACPDVSAACDPPLPLTAALVTAALAPPLAADA
jgi:hypothetical protein